MATEGEQDFERVFRGEGITARMGSPDERFFLYLDILGFKELMAQPDRVRDLYQLMDRLNVHGHPDFRAIVFSDTLLVYNVKPASNDDERRYYTMFLIEFAQDLLYRTIDRGFYFRAILTQGPFEHLRFQNLDAFFGEALVDAYTRESSLVGVGLFIHESLLPYNVVFRTIRHCEMFHHVFLCQTLFSELSHPAEYFPLDAKILDSADLTYFLYPQLRFLQDVWDKARNHPSPQVRAKFQATWTFHELALPGLCSLLAGSGFDLSTVSTANWAPSAKKHEDELNSPYYQFDAANLRQSRD